MNGCNINEKYQPKFYFWVVPSESQLQTSARLSLHFQSLIKKHHLVERKSKFSVLWMGRSVYYRGENCWIDLESFPMKNNSSQNLFNYAFLLLTM